MDSEDEVFIENRYLQSDGYLRRVISHLEPIRTQDFNPPHFVQRCISNIILIIFLLIILYIRNLFLRASLDLINYIGIVLVILSFGYAVLIRFLTYRSTLWWSILAISSQEIILYKDQRVIWHFPIRTVKFVKYSIRKYAQIIQSDNIRNRNYISCLELYFQRKFATYLLVFPLVGDIEETEKDMIISKIDHMAGIFRRNKHDPTFDKVLQLSWLLLLAIGFILYAI